MLDIDGPVLDGKGNMVGNRVRHTNAHLNLFRLCTRVSTTKLKDCLGWCGVSSFLVLGFYGDYFTISHASRNNHSFMGGSDVVDVSSRC